MLKVLYLLNHAGKGGTEGYIYSLVESLNNQKLKAYFAYNEHGPLVERLESLGVETFQIKMNNPFDLKAANELSKLCKKLDISLIHTHYLRENYIALLSRFFRPKTKVVYTYHFILENNLIQRMANRILTHFEANIIAVCNKGKEMMVSNWIKGEKIRVIFNGVDPRQWETKEASTIRQEFSIPEDTYLLLSVSRFSIEKGHKFLINSIGQLKEITDRKFMCILAGDGPLLEEVKQQVSDLGLKELVIFAGFRKDVKNLIDGCNLHINSSECEALSIAITEALAAGMPVIATDVGGNGDIINLDTKCGILVEYNNPKAMAEAILKVMNDEELQSVMSKNAKLAAREIFNIEIMVNKTFNVYLESM